MFKKFIVENEEYLKIVLVISVLGFLMFRIKFMPYLIVLIIISAYSFFRISQFKKKIK